MSTVHTETEELGVPMYPQCASGAGIIAFPLAGLNTSGSDHLPILLSRRPTRDGLKLGITGGGFVEISRILTLRVGTIIETALEAHREGFEENLGFEHVITTADFLERAQPIATFHVRSDDPYNNHVHSCVFYALGLRPAEWDRVSALPPGEERVGDLLVANLWWGTRTISRRKPEADIELIGEDGEELAREHFHHQHEMHALGMLAWHAANGKLWGKETL